MTGLLARAWFSAQISEFLGMGDDEILGRLTRASAFAVEPTQRDAWVEEIRILRDVLAGQAGLILMEYTVPRMGSRVDAVLLIGPVIFVVEFKVGERSFDGEAIDQVWDYALDLKNFHEGSHAPPVVPIVVATEARRSTVVDRKARDGVYVPQLAHPAGMRKVIADVLEHETGGAIPSGRWVEAGYYPTPTIVEAARSLYSQHTVEEIARSDAGAKNLSITSSHIEKWADSARRNREKVICFVTGVPGAGKTLVGLNIATRRSDEKSETHAVYLSGNGPLVDVLRAALVRDEAARRKARATKIRKGEIKTQVKAFIQNVHHFRDEGLLDTKAPADHIVVFDEAQRAWNRKKTSDFMKRRKGRAGFDQSEPEFLISYLDRHSDWAFIVCLVGGGQEIHTGEAGISEWLEAVRTRFAHWRVVISGHLEDEEYAAGRTLEIMQSHPKLSTDDHLHLAVSMRSFRAENVSKFVKSVLDLEKAQARENLDQLMDRYPVVLTRDLQRAKRWLREHARGSERYGIMASSKAMRLKPHAIDIRVTINPVHWFLNGKADTRSSFYLEDAATEFQVQGLEVDWACVSWDADLRHSSKGWSYHDFRGTRWVNVRSQERQAYLVNAYRVLLTRARQGMVLFVPEGDPDDPTRKPEYYDGTYRYLEGLGIQSL